MDRLPNEILINILRYLRAYDLIQFCTAYEHYEYFLAEKDLNRVANWSWTVESQTVDFCETITTKFNYLHIRSLNINGIYWIPAKNLRKLLGELKSIQELYAIDTKLGMTDKDCEAYSNLAKLAVSAEICHFDYGTIFYSKFLDRLRALCLKITRKKTKLHSGPDGLVLFFAKMKKLEELWICDEDGSSSRINYEHIIVGLKELKKVAIRSKTVLPLYDFSYVGLQGIFACRRNDTDVEMIFEKLVRPESKRSLFSPNTTELEDAWEIFGKLHKDIPCGPKEAKLMFMKQDINNIFFEDLNFSHAGILCNIKFITAAWRILSSKNVARLKRLSASSCLFRPPDAVRSESEDYDSASSKSGVKRRRCGIKYDPQHQFKKVAENIRGLTELEIYSCLGDRVNDVYSGYSAISTLQNLEKLTLEIPIILDGKFLKEVFLICKRLQSVNFTVLGQNEKFMNDLCNNIIYATAVRDFRLDHTQISVDRLFGSFNEIEHKKLLRIFLKCDNLRYSVGTEKSCFSAFLKNNPQLIFFFLAVSKNTIKQNSHIKNILNTHQAGNSPIFYVMKYISSFNVVFPIPTAHHDFVFSRTNVSVIHIDDF